MRGDFGVEKALMFDFPIGNRDPEREEVVYELGESEDKRPRWDKQSRCRRVHQSAEKETPLLTSSESG